MKNKHLNVLHLSVIKSFKKKKTCSHVTAEMISLKINTTSNDQNIQRFISRPRQLCSTFNRLCLCYKHTPPITHNPLHAAFWSTLKCFYWFLLSAINRHNTWPVTRSVSRLTGSRFTGERDFVLMRELPFEIRCFKNWIISLRIKTQCSSGFGVIWRKLVRCSCSPVTQLAYNVKLSAIRYELNNERLQCLLWRF